MPVDTKVMVGFSSALKKSDEARCASRSALPVLTVPSSISALTELDSRSWPTTSCALTPSKRPRTFESPRWRTTNPTVVCEGSAVQVPAAKGSVVVERMFVMTTNITQQ